MWRRGQFTVIVIVAQAIILILFGALVEYTPAANPKHWRNNYDPDKGGNPQSADYLNHYYPMFQDVHVMIFVGFGFLMTFMKRYSFGSVAFNLLVAAFSIEWATLMAGFFHMHHGKIQIDVVNLLTSDFGAAAVLISFGAMLGRLSPQQLIVMALLEITLFVINEYIGFTLLQVSDVGESMFVHVFGAYFGLAVSKVMWRKEISHFREKEKSAYASDIFSMIGTIFLWMFWPSFNSALADGDEQARAVVNTYYSLAACCVTTFAVSALVHDEDKFAMEHIQNATLAGGVAVGASANMNINAWGAMLIGITAGSISVCGYRYLSPFMAEKLKWNDQCGVHNLHGMPGVLAAIVAAIVTGAASEKTYGMSLYQIWPARAPVENSPRLFEIQKNFTIEAGLGRTAGQQAGYQLLALVVTLLMAGVGGVVTGFILRIPIWNEPRDIDLYDDEFYWDVPADLPGGLDERRKSVMPDAQGRRKSIVLDMERGYTTVGAPVNEPMNFEMPIIRNNIEVIYEDSTDEEESEDEKKKKEEEEEEKEKEKKEKEEREKEEREKEEKEKEEKEKEEKEKEEKEKEEKEKEEKENKYKEDKDEDEKEKEEKKDSDTDSSSEHDDNATDI